MKVCSKCQTEQPEENFGKRSDRNGRRGQCNSCRAAYDREWATENRERAREHNRAHYARNRATEVARSRSWTEANSDRARDSHYRRKFGIALVDYERMYAEQGGCCAVCRCPETATDRRTGEVRRLHVDHDHVTKQVRGLLCTRCNMAVGYVLDDPERATALAEYLTPDSRGTKDCVRRAVQAGIPVRRTTVRIDTDSPGPGSV